MRGRRQHRRLVADAAKMGREEKIFPRLAGKTRRRLVCPQPGAGGGAGKVRVDGGRRRPARAPLRPASAGAHGAGRAGRADAGRAGLYRRDAPGRGEQRGAQAAGRGDGTDLPAALRGGDGVLVPAVQARGGRDARGAPDGGHHAGGPGICAAPADVLPQGGFGKPGVLLLPPQHGGHQQTEDAGLLHLPAGVLAEGDEPPAGA